MSQRLGVGPRTVRDSTEDVDIGDWMEEKVEVHQYQ